MYVHSQSLYLLNIINKIWTEVQGGCGGQKVTRNASSFYSRQWSASEVQSEKVGGAAVPPGQGRQDQRPVEPLPLQLRLDVRQGKVCSLGRSDQVPVQLCAVPLASLLADYSDAGRFCGPAEIKQVKLVGDCLRLGGSLLSSNPGNYLSFDS